MQQGPNLNRPIDYWRSYQCENIRDVSGYLLYALGAQGLTVFDVMRLVQDQQVKAYRFKLLLPWLQYIVVDDVEGAIRRQLVLRPGDYRDILFPDTGQAL